MISLQNSHFNSLCKNFLFTWILAWYLLWRNRSSERLWFQSHLIFLLIILFLLNCSILKTFFINKNLILWLSFLIFNLFVNFKSLELFCHFFILFFCLVLLFKILLQSIKILFVNKLIQLILVFYVILIFLKFFILPTIFSWWISIDETFIKINDLLHQSFFNHLIFLLNFIEHYKFLIFILILKLFFLNLFLLDKLIILILFYILNCSELFKWTAWSYLIYHF